MKISVVTASFNQGRFIQKCIDSVTSQQGIDVEHIILDNCSTDETADVINSYRDDHIGLEVVIIVEPDKGQTSAINKGFRLATGDVVCWLNTDEWYEDGALAKVADFFAVHPEVDVVFGDCNFVDVQGNLIKKKREFFYSFSMLIFYGCFIPSCSTFVRRRVIDDGVLLSENFKVTMDFDWYVRMDRSGYRFAHLPETLASFTWHESNISSTFVDQRRSERLTVQNNYSGVRGPRILRRVIYEMTRYFWIAVRLVRRSIG